MATADRRERERREREEFILDTAETMLSEHGYLGLNLDRLAEAVEYSKGTLYQHFETKEDIVLAIAARCARERVRLFEMAATFRGRSRERVLAVGVADDVLSEQGGASFQIMQMAKTPSLWERASEQRRLGMSGLENHCSQVIAGITRDAVSAGDLVASAQDCADIAFGLMTLALGTRLVATAPGWAKESGVLEPRRALRANQHRLLDGAGWKPLLAEWNYVESEKRIRELFGK